MKKFLSCLMAFSIFPVPSSLQAREVKKDLSVAAICDRETGECTPPVNRRVLKVTSICKDDASCGSALATKPTSTTVSVILNNFSDADLKEMLGHMKEAASKISARSSSGK